MKNHIARLLSFSFALFISGTTLGQQLDFRIQDEHGHPLEYAEVVFIQLPDSTVLGTQLTGRSGLIVNGIEPSEHLILQMSAPGRQTVWWKSSVADRVGMVTIMPQLGHPPTASHQPSEELDKTIYWTGADVKHWVFHFGGVDWADEKHMANLLEHMLQIQFNESGEPILKSGKPTQVRLEGAENLAVNYNDSWRAALSHIPVTHVDFVELVYDAQSRPLIRIIMI